MFYSVLTVIRHFLFSNKTISQHHGRFWPENLIELVLYRVNQRKQTNMRNKWKLSIRVMIQCKRPSCLQKHVVLSCNKKFLLISILQGMKDFYPQGNWTIFFMSSNPRNNVYVLMIKHVDAHSWSIKKLIKRHMSTLNTG